MKVLGKSRDAYLLESSDRRARSVLVAYRDGRPLCSFQLLMAATVVSQELQGAGSSVVRCVEAALLRSHRAAFQRVDTASVMQRGL